MAEAPRRLRRLPPSFAVAWLPAVLLLLAGCSGPADPDGGLGSADDGGPVVPPEPDTLTLPFALGAAAGTPVIGVVLPVDDGRRTPFEVPAGHGSLDATVQWECTTGPVCELDVELRLGESQLVTAQSGASPLMLHVDDPPEGRWTFWAFPSGASSVVVGLEGVLTVDLA